MSDLSEVKQIPSLKMKFEVGQCYAAVFEVVKDRPDEESVLVFMSNRDGHENLICDNLFKVTSLKQVS